MTAMTHHPTKLPIPRVRVALEWYLNPDHLPLIKAQAQARADGALDVALIVPDDHYDGFTALAQGEVEVVINEPLHLLEKHGDSLELQSLGTFFQTDGGVLVSEQGRRKLESGDAIRVASPVSNPVTDGLCRNILVGWMRKQHISVDPGQISVYEAGFDHIENLRNGADAAWLAFANIEGVHARMLGLPVQMCSTTDGDVPGFSALEIIVDRNARPDVQAALATFVRYVDEAVVALKADPDAALDLWCRASQSEATPLNRAMVTDTLTRFVSPVRPSASRWKPVWDYMQQQGSDVVDGLTFDRIFSPA